MIKYKKWLVQCLASLLVVSAFYSLPKTASVGAIAIDPGIEQQDEQAVVEMGRYKDSTIQVPNVIVPETQEANVRFGEFKPEQWTYSEELSDEFNSDTLSDLWYPAYMDWWPIQEKEGAGGSVAEYSLNAGVLHLISKPDRPFWWDQGLRKHGEYKVVGIMGGVKDYVNNGPSIDGVPIQKHVPYMDKGATTYGFFEFRSKFSKAGDIIPAVWMIGFHDKGGNKQNAEIDWPEFFNAETYPDRHNKISIWHWKETSSGFPERPSTDTDISMYLDEGEDYRDDWHTIGLEWAPGYVRYYFDGHLVREHKANIPYRMIPILSVNYRPGTVANPDPRDFEIDYYRVWKNTDVVDPYQKPVLPPAGTNIASYAHMSMFGQTSAQFDATPSEWLNDQDLQTVVYSGLQTKKADSNAELNLAHTPLPAYIYTDFYDPVEYNTIILSSNLARSQAPTLIDIEISEDGRTNWQTLKTDIPLDWKTNSYAAESIEIVLDEPVAQNEHMRIVVKQSNFNKAKKFALSEIEIGMNIKASIPDLPELPDLPVEPLPVQIPNPYLLWNFENHSFIDVIANKKATGSNLPVFKESDIANGNSGVHFDGIRSNADLEISNSGFLINQNLTISAWFKLDHVPESISSMLFQQLGSGHAILNAVPQNGKLVLSTYFGATNLYGKTDIKVGEWNHAAIVFNKSQNKIKLYLNGKHEAERTFTGYANNINENFRIGANKTGNGNYLMGMMDEVAFFQASLNEEQLARYVFETKPDMTGMYKVSAVEASEKIIVSNGTEAESVELPSKATVHLNGNYQKELNVLWDISTVNFNELGEYPVYGEIVLPSNDTRISNPEQIQASVTIVIVDKTLLESEIQAAQALYNQARTGTMPGEYPFGAKDELASAISTANQVMDSMKAEQAEIDEAIDSLQSSVIIFKSKVIAGEAFKATLSGPDVVEAGAVFDLTYQLSANETSVYAQDFTVNFDPAKVELLSVSSSEEGVEIVKTSVIEPGKVRVLTAKVNNSIIAQPISLSWKGLATTQSGTTISISDIEVSNAAGLESKLDETSHTLRITSVNVNDVNNDGKYSIGDLGIVAAAYGKSSADEDWGNFKHADVNNDGKVDILDLIQVAGNIIY